MWSKWFWRTPRGCAFIWVAPVLAVLALGACSPTFDWRDTRIDGHRLLALLPCKADRAQREVPVGDQQRALQMVGCKVGVRTFALSAVRLTEPGAAPQALQGWQRAAVQGWGLDSAAAPAASLKPFVPQGALALPASQRGTWVRAGAEPLRVDAAWFARADAQGLALYHAVVLSPGKAGGGSVPTDAATEDAIQTFFSNLRFE